MGALAVTLNVMNVKNISKMRTNLFTAPNHTVLHPLSNSVGHFGACCWQFSILQAAFNGRQCGIAGSEQVPPLLQGWYLFFFKCVSQGKSTTLHLIAQILAKPSCPAIKCVICPP